jgi:abortive infection alpha-like protein
MSDDSIRKALGSALEQFLGPGANETGQLIADQIRYLRWRIALRVVERAEKIAKARNLSKGSVPIKFLVPFFEKASLQDDEEPLSEMWSALLAKARDSYQDRYVSYVDILNALSPTEAAILSTMWSSADEEVFSAWNLGAPMAHLQAHLDYSPMQGSSLTFGREVTAQDFATEGSLVFFFHEDDVANMNELNFRDMSEFIDLSHLQSLGLISILWSAVRTPTHRHFVAIACLSPLGYDFLDACEGKDDD